MDWMHDALLFLQLCLPWKTYFKNEIHGHHHYHNPMEAYITLMLEVRKQEEIKWTAKDENLGKNSGNDPLSFGSSAALRWLHQFKVTSGPESASPHFPKDLMTHHHDKKTSRFSQYEVWFIHPCTSPHGTWKCWQIGAGKRKYNVRIIPEGTNLKVFASKTKTPGSYP